MEFAAVKGTKRAGIATAEAAKERPALLVIGGGKKEMGTEICPVV